MSVGGHKRRAAVPHLHSHKCRERGKAVPRVTKATEINCPENFASRRLAQGQSRAADGGRKDEACQRDKGSGSNSPAKAHARYESLQKDREDDATQGGPGGYKANGQRTFRAEVVAHECEAGRKDKRTANPK